MREPYVRPVTSAAEPKPRWRAVWRFRVIALIVLAVLAYFTVVLAKSITGTEQNPTTPFGAGLPRAGRVVATSSPV